MGNHAEVRVLLEIASELELRLVNIILDTRLKDVYADELLSTMSSLKEVIGRMPESSEEAFWESGKEAVGKINRIHATIRVLMATKKLGVNVATEIGMEILALKSRILDLSAHP